jgi:hypothetical protein
MGANVSEELNASIFWIEERAQWGIKLPYSTLFYSEDHFTVDRVWTLVSSDQSLGERLIAELNMGIFSKERTELRTDKWILHRDNAPAHDVLRVC